MLDEILEFFDRRKARPVTDRQGPRSDRIGGLLDDDDDDGDGGRYLQHDDDRHGARRHDRFDRRSHVDDLD